MNTPVRGRADAEQSDAGVIDYLESHPDFFERHPNVLTRLRLPHARGPSTVSLVERQVQVLRDKNKDLESKLHELVEVARSNDALIGNIHSLACRLIRARGALQIVDALEASLREDFAACEWLLVLTNIDNPELSRIQHRHLRAARRDDPGLRAFETFFESARPRCGQIRDSQRDYLFGPDAAAIGSAALIPLGPRAAHGVLAIGSADANRFNAGMSTDYLVRIGELVSAAVGEL